MGIGSSKSTILSFFNLLPKSLIVSHCHKAINAMQKKRHSHSQPQNFSKKFFHKVNRGPTNCSQWKYTFYLFTVIRYHCLGELMVYHIHNERVMKWEGMGGGTQGRWEYLYGKIDMAMLFCCGRDHQSLCAWILRGFGTKESTSACTKTKGWWHQSSTPYHPHVGLVLMELGAH